MLKRLAIVLCRGTARHERMTDSRSRQPTEVTATSEADGVADSDSGRDQLPTDDQMNTRHVNSTHIKTSPRNVRLHQLVPAVRPPVAES